MEDVVIIVNTTNDIVEVNVTDTTQQVVVNISEMGTAGVGVPAGGSAGQVLRKINSGNYNTEWASPSGGVDSVNGQTGVVVLDAEDLGAYPNSNPSNFITASSAPVQSVAGRTGAVTLSKADVGLSNADNTSDANKPVSTAQQTAINGRQPLASVLTNTTASFTTAQETKLSGIEAGAQVNTVTSVAGKAGAVVLAKADVGLSNVDNTSDANKPISTATQTALGNKADLVGGLVPTSQIPAIAITEFLGEVANQSAMLALIGQRGDWCIRQDLGSVFILIADAPNLLASWQEVEYPSSPVASVNGQVGVIVLSATDVGAYSNSNPSAFINAAGAPVQSVNSQTGTVTITASSVGLGNVDNTSDINKPISTATQTAINGKVSNSKSITNSIIFG